MNPLWEQKCTDCTALWRLFIQYSDIMWRIDEKKGIYGIKLYKIYYELPKIEVQMQLQVIIAMISWKKQLKP